MICLWIVWCQREVWNPQLLLQKAEPVVRLISHLGDAGRLLTGIGLMVKHDDFEISALKLLYLLTKVLIRGDEDYKVLWASMLLQHMHEAVCSLDITHNLLTQSAYL